MARLKSIEGAWLPVDDASRKELQGVSEVEVSLAEKAMTPKQQSAVHVYIRQIAQALNDAGLDMKSVLKPEVEIPWTEYSVKEFIWRPVQKSMIGKDSTTDLNSAEPSDVHRVVDRHLAEKFGISRPWPSKSGPHYR